jgi:Rad3-related DNA helicase
MLEWAEQHEHGRLERLRCPYALAKRQVPEAPFAALNTAYFLNKANFVGGFTRDQLVVIDEADALESILLDQIEIKLNPKRVWS